ncbi:hypothetical protein RSOLAG1IB_12128 [Rhizoctonia solani AG-1 IB]|uniref:Uncharacterized protein n=1 Tax=Thanatephorus cucumeris (strain AG1-IB / isolate 7/3/14) TaxID=1108050 RepID=A0A0B7FLA8_THACB|nr:hypothetical protein RSOLAG1IB_12128 [Rhizoctonia solani AG-1 IB]
MRLQTIWYNGLCFFLAPASRYSTVEGPGAWGADWRLFVEIRYEGYRNDHPGYLLRYPIGSPSILSRRGAYAPHPFPPHIPVRAPLTQSLAAI